MYQEENNESDRGPEDNVFEFITLGCMCVAHATLLSAGEVVSEATIEKIAHEMFDTIKNGVQGNKSGNNKVSDGDLILLVEKFVRLAYHKLDLSKTE